MKLTIEGVECKVPLNYNGYGPEKVEAVAEAVKRIKARERHLISVYIDRVVHIAGKTPRVDGGYFTKVA